MTCVCSGIQTSITFRPQLDHHVYFSCGGSYVISHVPFKQHSRELSNLVVWSVSAEAIILFMRNQRWLSLLCHLTASVNHEPVSPVFQVKAWSVRRIVPLPVFNINGLQWIERHVEEFWWLEWVHLQERMEHAQSRTAFQQGIIHP